jgi:hypothetical protein
MASGREPIDPPDRGDQRRRGRDADAGIVISRRISAQPRAYTAISRSIHAISPLRKSASRRQLSLTAGSSSTNITFPGASCNGGGIFPSTSYTISWNNGQSSTMTMTATDVIVGGTSS